MMRKMAVLAFICLFLAPQISDAATEKEELAAQTIQKAFRKKKAQQGMRIRHIVREYEAAAHQLSLDLARPQDSLPSENKENRREAGYEISNEEEEMKLSSSLAASLEAKRVLFQSRFGEHYKHLLQKIKAYRVLPLDIQRVRIVEEPNINQITRNAETQPEHIEPEAEQAALLEDEFFEEQGAANGENQVQNEELYDEGQELQELRPFQSRLSSFFYQLLRSELMLIQEAAVQNGWGNYPKQFQELNNRILKADKVLQYGILSRLDSDEIAYPFQYLHYLAQEEKIGSNPRFININKELQSACLKLAEQGEQLRTVAFSLACRVDEISSSLLKVEPPEVKERSFACVGISPAREQEHQLFKKLSQSDLKALEIYIDQVNTQLRQLREEKVIQNSQIFYGSQAAPMDQGAIDRLLRAPEVLEILLELYVTQFKQDTAVLERAHGKQGRIHAQLTRFYREQKRAFTQIRQMTERGESVEAIRNLLDNLKARNSLALLVATPEAELVAALVNQADIYGNLLTQEASDKLQFEGEGIRGTQLLMPFFETVNFDRFQRIFSSRVRSQNEIKLSIGTSH